MDGRKKAAVIIPIAVAAAALATIALWPLMPPYIRDILPGGNVTAPPPSPGGNTTNGGAEKIPVNVLSSPSAFPFVDKWVAQYNAGAHLGTARPDYSAGADGITDPLYSNATGFLSSNSADVAIAGRAPAGWGNQTVLMPVSPQAVAIVYNVPGLPDVPSGLKLDAPTLAAIFSGNITQWDDPRIKDRNPDVALPAEKIVVVREGTSGSPSDLLAQYIGNATAWPPDSHVADSPDALSTAVRQTPYSIGYVDFTYALQTRMTYAALANSDGEYVLPTIESIAKAVQNGTVIEGQSNGTDLSLAPRTSVGELGSGSYPVVGFYYAVLGDRELVPGSPEYARAAAALDFANWAASDEGQRILVDMQYPWIYDQSDALAGYAASLQSKYNSTVALMNSTALSNFTDNPDDSVYGQVATANGSVYIVWQESMGEGNYDVLFRSSSDAGATFGNTTNLSGNAGFSEHPQLAASGDHVHVAWPDDTSGSRQVLYAKSADGGQTFGEAEALGEGGSFNTEIAAFEDRVYAVWQAGENGTIILRASSDAGETFGGPVTIAADGIHPESYPKVAAYGSGVHVAWVAEDGVYYAKSSDGGATFSEASKLSGDETAGEAQVAAYGDNVYVVWGGLHATKVDSVGYAKSTDGGSTFAAPAQIESDALQAPSNVELAIAPTESGHTVYVAAQAAVSGNEEIMLLSSADGGATFTEPENLSNNSGVSECPSISISGTDAFVVWEDGTTGNHEIFLAKRPA